MGTALEEEVAKRGRFGKSTSETPLWPRRALPAHAHQQLAALLLPSAPRAPRAHACSLVCSSRPSNQSPEPAQDQLSRAPHQGCVLTAALSKGWMPDQAGRRISSIPKGLRGQRRSHQVPCSVRGRASGRCCCHRSIMHPGGSDPRCPCRQSRCPRLPSGPPGPERQS